MSFIIRGMSFYILIRKEKVLQLNYDMSLNIRNISISRMLNMKINVLKWIKYNVLF